MDFRQYDNALGRFHNMDRLAELAPGITPYRFAFNNPNYWSDPSGLFESWAAAFSYILQNKTYGTIGYTGGDNGLYYINTGTGIDAQSMMMIDGNLVIGGTMIEEITVERSSGGGGGGSGIGGFAFADGGSSHNSDLLRKGGRDAQWIDFKGTLNVAMALLNFRLGRSLPKGKGTNGGRPTIDNKTSDAIDAVNYGAEALKNNPNATTMDVQNVSPVAPQAVEATLIHTQQDTASQILQYWKDGLHAGGSGFGEKSGRLRAVERAKQEMKENPHLDSIQVIPMYNK